MVCVVPAVFGIIVRDPPPSPNDYKYSYNIEDPTTGDSKSQHEVRLGDVVTGAYTVLGPDGTKRTVEYTADAKHGFKAVLREDPVSNPLVNPAPAPVHYNYQPANDFQYQTPNPYPVFASVLHPPQHSNYVEQQSAKYFSPQTEAEPRVPFDGNYFVPANHKK